MTPFAVTLVTTPVTPGTWEAQQRFKTLQLLDSVSLLLRILFTRVASLLRNHRIVPGNPTGVFPEAVGAVERSFRVEW